MTIGLWQTGSSDSRRKGIKEMTTATKITALQEALETLAAMGRDGEDEAVLTSDRRYIAACREVQKAGRELLAERFADCTIYDQQGSLTSFYYDVARWVGDDQVLVTVRISDHANTTSRELSPAANIVAGDSTEEIERQLMLAGEALKDQ